MLLFGYQTYRTSTCSHQQFSLFTLHIIGTTRGILTIQVTNLPLQYLIKLNFPKANLLIITSGKDIRIIRINGKGMGKIIDCPFSNHLAHIIIYHLIAIELFLYVLFILIIVLVHIGDGFESERYYDVVFCLELDDPPAMVCLNHLESF